MTRRLRRLSAGFVLSVHSSPSRPRHAPPLLDATWPLPAVAARRLASSSAGHDERLAVFMAGLPGSGKTRIIHSRYDLSNQGTIVLDLDLEMQQHPSYDSDHPESVYAVPGAYTWADERVEARFQACLQDPKFNRVVVDGTGTKVERRVQRMQDARAAGLTVEMVLVRVSLATALYRNTLRARHVPQETLCAYEQELNAAVEAEKAHCDRFVEIDNERHDRSRTRQRKSWGRVIFDRYMEAGGAVDDAAAQEALALQRLLEEERRFLHDRERPAEHDRQDPCESKDSSSGSGVGDGHDRG